MKRKIVLFAAAAVILLFPLQLRLKDGGTVQYRAILYSVQNVHRLNPDLESGREYLEGTIVEILRVEVFNDVH